MSEVSWDGLRAIDRVSGGERAGGGARAEGRWRRCLQLLVLADAVTTLLLWLIGWNANFEILWASDVQAFQLSSSALDVAVVSLVKGVCLGGVVRSRCLAAAVAVAALVYLLIKAVLHGFDAAAAAAGRLYVRHHLLWVLLVVSACFTLVELWVLLRRLGSRDPLASSRRNAEGLLEEAAGGLPSGSTVTDVGPPCERQRGTLETLRAYHREHQRLIVFAKEKEEAKKRAKAELKRTSPDPLDGRRLWLEFRQSASLSVVVPATVLSFSLCLMSIVTPTVKGRLFDAVIAKVSSDDRDIASLVPFFWLTLGLTIYGYVANVAVGILFALARWRMSMAMRKKLFWAIISQDVSFFDGNPAGTLTSRLVHDADKMQGVLNTTADTIGKTLVQFSSGIIAIFMIEWRLAVVGIISFPVSIHLTKVTGRIVGWYSLIQNDSIALANAIANESIGNIRTVISNAAEDVELRAYSASIDTYIDVIMHTMFSETFLRFAKSLMDQTTSMILLVYGMYLIVQRQITLGQYIAFTSYLGTFNTGFNQLMKLFVNLKTVKTASQRYFELIDRVPLITDPAYTDCVPPMPAGIQGVPPGVFGGRRRMVAAAAAAAADAPLFGGGGRVGSFASWGRCTGVITFEDVTFAYPSIVEVGFSSLRQGTLPWSEQPSAAGLLGEGGSAASGGIKAVLKGLTFEVRPGQFVALVGRSGAGKSSTVKLIQRFYDPMEGNVKLDGQDLKEWNLHRLRSQFGYVEQEPNLFNRSVRENIAYGVTAGEDQVVRAAQLANAHDFIMELPQQYETKCGERGVRLSGGQKQRLAIARAVVRDPAIILLDEATASLDTESEHLVQKALERVRVDRSVVVIAHRLSTIRGADTILVFDRGEIVERGTHDSLLQLEGRYAALVKQQLL